MVKILNVQPFDYSGSIQRRSLKVAMMLRKEGFETIFLIPESSNSASANSFFCEAKTAGFKTIRTGTLRPFDYKNLKLLKRNIGWLFSFPKTLVNLFRILKSEQVQVVQINGLVCVQEALAVSLFCRNKGLWVLISDLYPRITVLALQPLIHNIRLKVFVSKKVAPYYGCTQFPKIVYEPVDAKFFDPNSIKKMDKQTIIDRYSLSFSFPILICVANISPVKGFEYLIESVKIVKSYFPKVKLLIIGDVTESNKTYYNTIKNLVIQLSLIENIIFVGYVEHANLPVFLSVADLFVLGSIHEGTPVSILEAMAMRKAVVSTNVGGISELVKDVTGILVPPKDPQALAIAIVDLSNNDSKRYSFGINSREIIKSQFSIDKCVSRYRELYKKFNTLTVN